MTSIEEAIRSGAVLAKVKPLEWREEYGYAARAEHAFGVYAITDARVGSPVKLEGGDHVTRWFASVDEAKAAAQADYEARILSALSLDVRALAEERDRLREADGTERLCRALYGRKASARDYVGGSDARMLHDAADRLAANMLGGPVRAVSDNGKRWRIVPVDGDWEMQPTGHITAGEAEALCKQIEAALSRALTGDTP